MKDYFERTNVFKDIVKMPKMKVLSKEQWGGLPLRTDFEDEVITEVELPAKYVIISATSTRPCVALEDCSILMKRYQEYFHFNEHQDVPFNFMVGPGGVALEGRGWNKNCIEFKQEGREEVPVWNPVTETKGVRHKIKDISQLKESLGFQKPRTKKENLHKKLEEIDKRKSAKSLGDNKKDMNKYFGKSIVIGLISEVFVSGNPSTRALDSALGLIKYGVRNNYIRKRYKLEFNFDPIYKLDHAGPEIEMPEEMQDSWRTVRTSKIEEFDYLFMEPTMKAPIL